MILKKLEINTMLIPDKKLNIKLIMFLSSSLPNLLLAENWPFDHTSKEAVLNYVPQKIFSVETTFLTPNSKGLGKLIEIYDDRCVYFYFFDYKQCFEMTEENYNKFVEFLENEKKWDSPYQDYCCKFSGFLQYSSKESILRSCSMLYSKDGVTLNERCGSSEEFEYEKRIFNIINELILKNSRLGLTMEGLLDDLSKTYKKYVWQSDNCSACIPSYFHSPELREKEK